MTMPETGPDATGPRMFRFGDRATEVLHPDIAEQILIDLKRTNPKLFGRLLQNAMVPELRRDDA